MFNSISNVKMKIGLKYMITVGKESLCKLSFVYISRVNLTGQTV